MADWKRWFVDVAVPHTSLPALVFLRSPHWPEVPISIDRRDYDRVLPALAEPTNGPVCAEVLGPVHGHRNGPRNRRRGRSRA